RGVELPDGLNYGTTMVLVAGQTVASALLLHLRSNLWNENATLVVLRTALDALGTSAVLMFGADEDRASWLAGNRIRATESLPALRNALRTKRPDIPDPESVFTWLSGHVHLT